MSDQYYRFFQGDYARDTGDLSLVEHGAYRLLLDQYYTLETLPSDINRLYRICRAFSEEERQAVSIVVTRFFESDGNGNLWNKRADKEIRERKAFLASQVAKAKAGAAARWGAKDKAEAMPEACPKQSPKNALPSPSPSPSPSPNTKRAKALFVATSDEVRLSEYLFHKIQENNPKAKEPNIQVWAKQVDLMIRRDNRTVEDIQAVIDWCQEDEFWRLNILSTEKLREQFDRLWLKMTGGNKSGNQKDDPYYDRGFWRTDDSTPESGAD